MEIMLGSSAPLSNTGVTRRPISNLNRPTLRSGRLGSVIARLSLVIDHRAFVAHVEPANKVKLRYPHTLRLLDRERREECPA